MQIKIDQLTEERLDVFLSKHLNINRSKLRIAFDNNIFLINNKPQKPSYKLKLNDAIEYNKTKLEELLNPSSILLPYKFDLDIIYEDDDLMVINKPKLMLTHPTKHEQNNTLVNALLYHTKTLSNIDKTRPGIVHRLDKNTSGLMLIAKTNDAHISLARQIKEKTAKRKYKAIVLGELKNDQGVIDKPLVHYLSNNVKMALAQDNNGLSAITYYKVIERFKNAALLELELKTGRTHQIRVHLASIGHPVFGDGLYGAFGYSREFNNIKTIDQLLQSYYISFIHPKTNKKLEFELEEELYSNDFIKVLKYLRSKK